MQISMDKKYKTRDGREVKIYSVEGNVYDCIHGAIKQRNGNWELRSWHKDGTTWSDGEDPLDLIEVKERKKFERWINVFGDNILGGLHSSKNMAEASRGDRKVFACVKVTIECEEGEGL